jgi:Flp pilus assembly protein TadD
MLDDGSRSGASVSVKTVTEQGQTVHQTVTETAPPPTTTAAPPPASTSGDALNAQAFQLMQRGDFAGALPLLQQAVQTLQGQTGDVNNGYANYNLGITLIRLGRCADAVPYLDAAQHLEPGRREVHDALKIARRCGRD